MTAPKLPPISALQALEPQPGGHWAVNEQEGDAIILSYVMDNGAEATTYTLHQCRTEEDIRKHCASFVYEYTDVYESGSAHQVVDGVPTEFGNVHEAAPQLFHSQSERSPGQYSTSQIQGSFPEHFLFGTQATIIPTTGPQAQASVQFEETTLAPQTQFYQQNQGYSIPNNQQLSQESFASGAVAWSLSGDMLPTTAGNAPISMPNTDARVSQDSTMFLGAWHQNWIPVNPNGAQGSSGEWDAFSRINEL